MINLYPDQHELIEKAGNAMRAGSKAVLIQAATGSGKSVMASELIRRAQAKGSHTWFTVPRRDLITQMSKTYAKFDIPHSFVAAGYQTNSLSNNMICSTDTLINRLDKITRAPKLAVIDECHIGSEGMNNLIKWFKSRGTYIVGLSATPVKLSGQGMGMWYDDMVQGLPIKRLIELQRLSQYRAFAPNKPDLSKVGKAAGDYAKGQLSSFMEGERQLIGDAVSHYKQHAMGKLALTYCVSIKHSQMVAESFRNAGIPAAHMDGETPPNERKRIIAAYARRELLVLTNCELMTYGFDLASQVDMDVTIECMIDLRPTQSLALQLQKWGRVLRYKDFPALIFDHASNIQYPDGTPNHGFPCTDRDWTLDSRSKKEREQAERTIKVRQCEQCFFCHTPAPVCPNCGYVYPVVGREIEQVEGELSEIEVAEVKKKARVEVGKAKTIAELQAIAAARGYASGWVYQMARVKGIRA
jgi:superfamily II DNA or RNA helicase